MPLRRESPILHLARPLSQPRTRLRPLGPQRCGGTALLNMGGQEEGPSAGEGTLTRNPKERFNPPRLPVASDNTYYVQVGFAS